MKERMKERMKVLEIKSKVLNPHDKFIELKLDDGSYLLFNTYTFYLDKIECDEYENIDDAVFHDNFIILEKSALSQISKDTTNDEMYDLFNECRIKMEEWHEKMSDVDKANEYIRLILECEEIY